jgi:hypothetical protein
VAAGQQATPIPSAQGSYMWKGLQLPASSLQARLWPAQASSPSSKATAPAASPGMGNASEGSPRHQAFGSGTQHLLPPPTRPGRPAVAMADTTAPDAAPQSLGGAATPGQPPRLQLDGHASAAQHSNGLPRVELRAMPGATLELEPDSSTGSDTATANEAAAARPMTAAEAMAQAESEGLADRCRYLTQYQQNRGPLPADVGPFATAEEAALHVARVSDPRAAAQLAATATDARLAASSANTLAASAANTRLRAKRQESGARGDSWGGKGGVASLPVTRPVALSMSKAYCQAVWAATGVTWRRVGVRCSNRQPNVFTEEGRQQHANKRMRVVKENRRHESNAHCICTASTLYPHCTASAPPLHRLCTASAPPLHRVRTVSAPHAHCTREREAALTLTLPLPLPRALTLALALTLTPTRQEKEATMTPEEREQAHLRREQQRFNGVASSNEVALTRTRALTRTLTLARTRTRTRT